MNIKRLLSKVQQLNTDQIAAEAMDATKTQLIELNNEQMMEGKNRYGTDITPSYQNDPYFKSKEAAQAYSDYKDEITPNPKRTPGTPNYYINGFFHNSRTVTVNKTAGKLEYNSSFSGAADIEAKTKGQLNGLNAEKKRTFIPQYLWPEYRKLVKEVLGI